MPILNVLNEIEIELTHKCNWNCRYCAICTHNLQEISEEAALEKVRSIAGKYDTVTFSGGEPGLLSRNILEQMITCIKSTNSNLCINTNGTFIEKYPDLVEKFDEIIYHCSRDLDDELKDYPYFSNIRYMLVIDDINILKLDNYLNKYLNITFDIVPASYEFNDIRRPLSMKNRMYIAKNFNNRITLDSYRRLFVDKNFNSVKYI